MVALFSPRLIPKYRDGLTNVHLCQIDLFLCRRNFRLEFHDDHEAVFSDIEMISRFEPITIVGIPGYKPLDSTRWPKATADSCISTVNPDTLKIRIQPLKS